MPTSSPDREETRAILALRSMPGVGDVSLARKLAQAGSAQRALSTESSVVVEAALRTADIVLARADACHARTLSRTDTEFPARLLELHDPPAVVFVRGRLPVAAPPAVAIVGTREASSYGLRVARAIATACANAGVAVISGLARGIDGAAHEAALRAGGRTVAVLGTGVDVAFPRHHRALQERIATDGLLVSELAPGVSGHAGTFPRRNRLIAALADVTVVVEAGRQSGALITAECALDLGRTVACVPNAIDAASAEGSNALLKEGAAPVLSPDDVLALIDVRATPTPAPILDGTAATCWSAIRDGANDLSSIGQRAQLGPRVVAAAVSLLELEGLVITEPGGVVRSTVERRGW